MINSLLPEIPELETTNYRLRPVTKNDAEMLFPILSNKETMKYITPTPVVSLEELIGNIEAYLNNFDKRKEIPWVIIEKNREKVIGLFRLHKIHLWHKKAEMGVIIGSQYQKKGVMTELLKTVMDFVFNTLKLNRLVGDIFAKNEGSKKLLEKYGFKKEGVLRQTDFDGENYHDTVVYSMLKSEYEQFIK